MESQIRIRMMHTFKAAENMLCVCVANKRRSSRVTRENWLTPSEVSNSHRRKFSLQKESWIVSDMKGCGIKWTALQLWTILQLLKHL